MRWKWLLVAALLVGCSREPQGTPVTLDGATGNKSKDYTAWAKLRDSLKDEARLAFVGDTKSIEAQAKKTFAFAGPARTKTLPKAPPPKR